MGIDPSSTKNKLPTNEPETSREFHYKRFSMQENNVTTTPDLKISCKSNRRFNLKMKKPNIIQYKSISRA